MAYSKKVAALRLPEQAFKVLKLASCFANLFALFVCCQNVKSGLSFQTPAPSQWSCIHSYSGDFIPPPPEKGEGAWLELLKAVGCQGRGQGYPARDLAHRRPELGGVPGRQRPLQPQIEVPSAKVIQETARKAT